MGEFVLVFECFVTSERLVIFSLSLVCIIFLIVIRSIFFVQLTVDVQWMLLAGKLQTLTSASPASRLRQTLRWRVTQLLQRVLLRANFIE